MSLRKKPWNRTNQPVFAISSKYGEENNMHIATYVTPISMQPKQYIAGIYHGTKTLELIEKEKQLVLQILNEDQYSLVNLLGKQSGYKVNKNHRLQKRGLITWWENFPILKDALAVILLQIKDTMEGGDHRIFLCDVFAHKNINEGTPLTLDFLREKKIIRG
jgi:flavin reductase (DIM6/NTAB) family NADH-FMN oxidoreductase RutF